MFRILSLVIIGATLIACGGGGSDSNTTGQNIVGVEDYDKLLRSDIEAKILKAASPAELEDQLKNGIRLNVHVAAFGELDVAPPLPAIDNAAGVLETARSSEFSSTNTHVRGVDESDFVKYDGHHLFMVTYPEYIWGEATPSAEIRILETDPTNANALEIGTIAVENGTWGEIGELYLVANNDGATEELVTLRSSWNWVAASEPSVSSLSIYPADFVNRIQMAAYDVTNPEVPSQSFSLEIDGYLQASRKVGDTIFLVTQFSPHLPHIHYYFATEEDAAANEQAIANLSLADLLPSVSINGGESRPLVAPEDCLLPVDANAFSGYHSLVTVVAVDVPSQSITSAKCVNSPVNGIYASTENIYLGGSIVKDWNSFDSFTTIHKFSLDKDIQYRSTGVVPGRLDWSDPSFRMSEYDEHLRVVSTSRNSRFQPEHHLSILLDSDSSDEMTVVAQLPNDSNPAPIGKPNEDIYAVRFIEDRAYIVTFLRIDPLYVIDLADPERPSIAGELEIPGFSTYLHPIGDNYLLGIGQGGQRVWRCPGGQGELV